MSDKADKIRVCIQNHPDWPDWRICRAVTGGAHADEVRAIRGVLGSVAVVEKRLVAPGPALVSLAKISERYDTKALIMREISKLPKGQLILEDDLRAIVSGQDRNRVRRIVENNDDELKMYRVSLKLGSTEAKWYWGKAQDIAEALRLRDMYK
jgi:hypothetical protein